MRELLRIAALFAITALAEILGCYLPWLVLKQGRTPWLLVPAAICSSDVRVVAHAASECCRSYLRCVWRNVHRGSLELAVRCRRDRADALGHGWCRRGAGGHGDHCLAAGSALRWRRYVADVVQLEKSPGKVMSLNSKEEQ
jgi:hypothetical protein